MSGYVIFEQARACIFTTVVFHIRVYLTSLLYLTELESLHMPQTMPAFTRCNKEGLVKGLWRNHSHEPKVSLIHNLLKDKFGVGMFNMIEHKVTKD